MEKSSYSFNTVIKKLIPGFVPGILFSKEFDKIHKKFSGTLRTKHLDTIDKRIQYLSDLGEDWVKEILPEYIFNDEINCTSRPNVLINPINKSIVVFLECMSDRMYSKEYGNPARHLYIWRCIRNHRKRTLKDVMCKITSLIYPSLFNHYDSCGLEDEIDQNMDPDYEQDKEVREQAAELSERFDYINSIMKKYKRISLKSLLEKLKQNDRKAYEMIIDYVPDIFKIRTKHFKPYHFIPFGSECENGMMDSNYSFFNVCDEPDSYWDVHIDYIQESPEGITNVISTIEFNKESGLNLSNIPENIKKDCLLFGRMKTLFSTIETYIKCN